MLVEQNSTVSKSLEVSKYRETAIVTVLRALRSGLETSRQIADATGINQDTVCRYLHVWSIRGKAKRCGKFYRPDKIKLLIRWKAI
jgi:hypothetical protein